MIEFLAWFGGMTLALSVPSAAVAAWHRSFEMFGQLMAFVMVFEAIFCGLWIWPLLA